jgi:hypothetical protein
VKRCPQACPGARSPTVLRDAFHDKIWLPPAATALA